MSRRLGLQAYPFTTFTTGHEARHAEELFVPMTEYGPIQESFRSGQNMIVLGERGVGKTAVLEEFQRRVPAGRVHCTCCSPSWGTFTRTRWRRCACARPTGSSSRT